MNFILKILNNIIKEWENENELVDKTRIRVDVRRVDS